MRILMLAMFAMFAGCTYNYAVDTESVELPYRTYYYGDREKRYDFYTVLYSEKDLGDSKNYSGFNIHVSHLYKETNTKYKGNYVSMLSFSAVDDSDIMVDYSTVKLIHRDAEGNQIEEVDTLSSFGNSNCNHWYKKVYNESDLSDSLLEYIYIELYVKGKRSEIEVELPITRQYHYSFWDVLMSV